MSFITTQVSMRQHVTKYLKKCLEKRFITEHLNMRVVSLWQKTPENAFRHNIHEHVWTHMNTCVVTQYLKNAWKCVTSHVNMSLYAWKREKNVFLHNIDKQA